MTRVDGAGLQRSASPQRSTPATLRIIGAPGSLVGTTTNRAAILPDRIEVSRRADRIPTLMKTLAALLSAVAHPFQRWNVRLVLWMVVGICVLIAIFTVGFHVLMAAEGREFSWATGIYWTLTVMSTLGFGDITFESDAGRLFPSSSCSRASCASRGPAIRVHPVHLRPLDDPTGVRTDAA